MAKAKPKKKKSFAPPAQVLIIGVFFLSFVVWAFKECSNTKSQLQAEAEPDVESPVQELPNVTQETEATITPQPAPNPIMTNPPTANSPKIDLRTGQQYATTSETNNLTTTEIIRVSPLFVTIDGLNLRRGPSLDSAIILKLKLDEEVGFMNEVTDSTSQISLGNEIANEPWVKVRHKKGRVGWVYGAGVNYYKRKKIIIEE